LFGLKTTRTVFADLTSKLVVTVFSDLTSKLVATVSSGLASKPAATVFTTLASKLVATVFLGLASKLVVSFLVEPQNQGGGGFFDLGFETGSPGLLILASKLPRRFFGLGLNQVGFGLSVAPQNRRREVGMGHASRSNGMLGVEVSLTRVF
jgi:hypothetical protein